MSGLKVRMLSDTVLKFDCLSWEGSVSRQIRHLNQAATLGLQTPLLLRKGVTKAGREWAIFERIKGPMLQDAAVDLTRVIALQNLISIMERSHLYVGDLHERNLIWSDEKADWIIIDCGAVRDPNTQPIQVRLRQKWRRIPQWIHACKLHEV